MLNSIITGPTAVRASNSVGYFLPGNLGGFYGQAQIYRGENSSTAANSSDGNGAAVRLGYSAGPINVAFATSRTNYALVAAPAAGQVTGNVRQSNLGASWNFGVATVIGMISRDTAEAITGRLSGRGALLAATVPVGPGLIKASVSQYTTDVATGTDPRARKIALGYVHNLSKRTAVYTTIARVTNNATSNASVFGGAAAASTSNGNASTGYDLGVRHSF
jgi:predicted porin